MKEIVIKVDDEFYEKLMDRTKYMHPHSLYTLADAVRNGRVLPKGHEELIDTKELIQDFVKAEENMKGNGVTSVFDVHEITNMILSQEVIVEADKEEE